MDPISASLQGVWRKYSNFMSTQRLNPLSPLYVAILPVPMFISGPGWTLLLLHALSIIWLSDLMGGRFAFFWFALFKLESVVTVVEAAMTRVLLAWESAKMAVLAEVVACLLITPWDLWRNSGGTILSADWRNARSFAAFIVSVTLNFAVHGKSSAPGPFADTIALCQKHSLPFWRSQLHFIVSLFCLSTISVFCWPESRIKWLKNRNRNRNFCFWLNFILVIVGICQVSVTKGVWYQLLADMLFQLDCGGLNQPLQVLGIGVTATFVQQHLADLLRCIMLYGLINGLKQNDEIEDNEGNEDEDNADDEDNNDEDEGDGDGDDNDNDQEDPLQ